MQACGCQLRRNGGIDGDDGGFAHRLPDLAELRGQFDLDGQWLAALKSDVYLRVKTPGAPGLDA